MSTTIRPVKGCEENCPFTFSVYWSVALQRWYLPKQASGCTNHMGHVKRLPFQVRLAAGSVGEEEREIQEQMFNCQQRPNAVSRMTYERTGVELETYSLRHLRKKLEHIIFGRGENYPSVGSGTEIV